MERIQNGDDGTVVSRFSDGKDEMNLAEFPLCALAHRLRPEQKTLHFEDRIFDERRGEMITRQLTITGSDAYGLPTARDDEVLLGLIQISKLSQFEERSVRFSRYQLIQILGWRQESKSYRRIEDSLNRWTGVTLYYKNAWWDRKRQRWVDEKFHILDNVRLFRPEPGVAPVDPEDSTSVFIWNEVIFRSFNAGNLRSIDFDFFRDLRTAIAKRLYRFLDKRFHHRKRLEFDLKSFAWEHTGLSRSYDSANLKRKLSPGITELEQRGYLRAMEPEERFRKIRGGEWRVVFEQAQEPPAGSVEKDTSEPDPVWSALLARGVSPSTARLLLRNHPRESIQNQLEVFDYLVQSKDPKVSRNPPGFLVSAIRGEYVPPKAYADLKNAKLKRQADAARRRATEERNRQESEKLQRQELEQEKLIQGFWKNLSPEAKTEAESEALALATPGQLKMLNRGGTVAEATRGILLKQYATRQVSQPKEVQSVVADKID